MSARPPLLVLHAPGTNRDTEAAWAGDEAGFSPSITHVADLIDGTVKLSGAAAVIVPGGFSHGDALGAGVRLAMDLRLDLADALREFVGEGGLILGICNGFQALVKSGLLPGPSAQVPVPEPVAGDAAPGATRAEQPGQPLASTTREGEAVDTGATGQSRRVTLTHNERGRFECRWVHLQTNTMAAASWLSDVDGLIHCPVAHGEGRFVTADQITLEGLRDQSMVAFRYVGANGEPAKGRYPINPNGSHGDVAGICDATGRIVGLMPHPEDHIRHQQRPFGPPGQSGLALFQAMRKAVR